ncbi:hypothetical protein [Salinisphaera sp. G21_0]|uniref:hypothetical protein n=1 Tax=Salinisphaera sp. G21_0 TaxID=2821094 RepID=UPI001ADC3B5F|nr:hypothetical protein [Salinisphaera sp. G21_0]MBO9483609.1 hypothetical protein [Salinisphaera sp. G21_0]
MDRCNAGSNFFSVSSCLQKPSESPLVPSGSSSSKPGVTGCSIQTGHSLQYEYLRKGMINQDMPSSLRSLDDFSISQLPSPENESVLPQLSLEDLDQVLSCDFSREPVDDDFAFTDLTLTNVQLIAQKFSLSNSLLSFSQPSSRPVAMIDPLIKDTHEQITTKTTEFTAPESSGSVEPLPLTLSVAHQQTDEKKASFAPGKRRSAKKTYRECGKGLAAKSKCNAKYFASDKGKVARAKYFASDKGKAARAKNDAKYAATVKGKVTRAISNAKSNAYRSALKKGFSEKEARKKGESAANAKKRELLLMDLCTYR